MQNEDQLIDNALLYANDKVPRKLIADCKLKRNNLCVISKVNEKYIDEYEEAVLKQAAVFYEEAMHYLVELHKFADSDVLQGLFSTAS